MTTIKIKQLDDNDCGIACLTSIGNYYKANFPKIQIPQFSKRSNDILEIIYIAEKIGLTAKTIQTDTNTLDKITLPAIAHLITKEKTHHYVVIYKVGKRNITFMDPKIGKMKKYTFDDFQKKWSGVLILISPNENFKTYSKNKSLLKDFWYIVQIDKKILTRTLIVAFFYNLIALVFAIYSQKLISFLLEHGKRNSIYLLDFALIIIAVFQIYKNSKKDIVAIKIRESFDDKLSLINDPYYLLQSKHSFDPTQSPEISPLSNHSIVRSTISNVTMEFIVNLFNLLFMFSLILVFYWKFALLTVPVIILYVIIYWAVNKYNTKMENIIIKTENQFLKLKENIPKTNLNILFRNTLTQFLLSIFIIIIIFIGSQNMTKENISFGEIVSFYFLFTYCISPATSLIGMNKTIHKALTASNSLFKIRAEKEKETKNKIELPKENIMNIKFENVTFYFNSKIEIFKNFNAVFKKNEITAVVGKTGSGKSTLLSLIQNIYTLNEGKISIGNSNIIDIYLQNLQNLIRIVPQQSNMFSGTIIDNITSGDSFPNIERVQHLAQQLGIDEFVNTFPNGFKTQIELNSNILTDAQKQHIIIARALYKNPEILLMDEPTSFLNVKEEKKIKKVIENFKLIERTVIICTQQLSTITHADTILLLKNGAIFESGNHSSLLEKKGEYYQLWHKQINCKTSQCKG